MVQYRSVSNVIIETGKRFTILKNCYPKIKVNVGKWKYKDGFQIVR